MESAAVVVLYSGPVLHRATIMGEVKLDLLELPPDEGHETTSSLQRAAQRFLSRSSRGAEYVANELL